ncbi:MAG: hypothetical protein ABI091_15705 [Ferruginibacter sp.]
MDEHLHSNVDKPITDTLRNQKYDLSEEVWNKIDDELNNEDKAISTRHHQQQVKNSIWTILFFMMVIGVTTFQFRKSQSTANIHSPVNHTPSDSKISDSTEILRY